MLGAATGSQLPTRSTPAGHLPAAPPRVAGETPPSSSGIPRFEASPSPARTARKLGARAAQREQADPAGARERAVEPSAVRGRNAFPVRRVVEGHPYRGGNRPVQTPVLHARKPAIRPAGRYDGGSGGPTVPGGFPRSGRASREEGHPASGPARVEPRAPGPAASVPLAPPVFRACGAHRGHRHPPAASAPGVPESARPGAAVARRRPDARDLRVDPHHRGVRRDGRRPRTGEGREPRRNEGQAGGRGSVPTPPPGGTGRVGSASRERPDRGGEGPEEPYI